MTDIERLEEHNQSRKTGKWILMNIYKIKVDGKYLAGFTEKMCQK